MFKCLEDLLMDLLVDDLNTPLGGEQWLARDNLLLLIRFVGRWFDVSTAPDRSPCEACNFLEKLASMANMLAITSTKSITKDYFNWLVSMLKDETISKNKNDVTTTIYIDNDA